MASNEKITTRPESGKMRFFSKVLILKGSIYIQLFDARRPGPDSWNLNHIPLQMNILPSQNIHVVIT